MAIRLAEAGDIPALITVRASVSENRLRRLVIGSADYTPYVADGRCWVWVEQGAVTGFSAIEADGASLWALFVLPEAEGAGIGRALLDMAITAARGRGVAAIELTTEARSRAEAFYRRYGFDASAPDAADEVRMRFRL